MQIALATHATLGNYAKLLAANCLSRRHISSVSIEKRQFALFFLTPVLFTLERSVFQCRQIATCKKDDRRRGIEQTYRIVRLITVYIRLSKSLPSMTLISVSVINVMSHDFLEGMQQL